MRVGVMSGGTRGWGRGVGMEGPGGVGGMSSRRMWNDYGGYRAGAEAVKSVAGGSARVVAGYRRTGSNRGPGRARGFGGGGAGRRPGQPRSAAGGAEEVALEGGGLDAVVAGLLVVAGMRRSEVSALRVGRGRRGCT